ncbi:hypothetical protein C8R46DRAFT_1035798 [Mycena filopes]|nr:hypothetical protein C8R46DRAFT_1035798 [Mycena filopes]
MPRAQCPGPLLGETRRLKSTKSTIEGERVVSEYTQRSQAPQCTATAKEAGVGGKDAMTTQIFWGLGCRGCMPLWTARPGVYDEPDIRARLEGVSQSEMKGGGGKTSHVRRSTQPRKGTRVEPRETTGGKHKTRLAGAIADDGAPVKASRLERRRVGDYARSPGATLHQEFCMTVVKSRIHLRNWHRWKSREWTRLAGAIAYDEAPVKASRLPASPWMRLIVPGIVWSTKRGGRGAVWSRSCTPDLPPFDILWTRSARANAERRPQKRGKHEGGRGVSAQPSSSRVLKTLLSINPATATQDGKLELPRRRKQLENCPEVCEGRSKSLPVKLQSTQIRQFDASGPNVRQHGLEVRIHGRTNDPEGLEGRGIQEHEKKSKK